MNLPVKLLTAIATAALMGSAQATSYDMDVLSPSTQLQSGLYASGTTFTDVFNFTIGAQYQTLLASAVGYGSDGTTGAGYASGLTLSLYDGAGTLVDVRSSSDGSLIDLSSALLSGDYSARVDGVAGVNGGYLFSIAAVPEPAEWLLLLCGLAIVTFMARRRSGLAAA